jgi:acyl-CoA thioester hydrolase
MTVLTPYVFATERPRRITAEERARLQEFLEPDEQRPRPPRPEPVTPSELGHFPVHVRFSDVDVYGHVNNVKYFEFFQEARISLFADLGREHVDVGGIHTVLAQSDVDYRRPVLFRQEPYECRSWVTAVGTTAMTLAAEIRDGDEVLSRCRTVAVCFDAVTQRPTPVPESLRAALVAALPS